MFNWIAKSLLVLTALAPVVLVFAWVLAADGSWNWALTLALLAVVLVATCMHVLDEAKKHLERMQFRSTSVEAADRENIAFLLLYLSPLFTASIGTLNWSVIVPTVLVFALLTATGYSYHFNPLLSLLGWHFYKVTSELGVTYVLVTKKHIRRAGETETVGQLTDYILIDLGGADATQPASGMPGK